MNRAWNTFAERSFFLFARYEYRTKLFRPNTNTNVRTNEHNYVFLDDGQDKWRWWQIGLSGNNVILICSLGIGTL